MARRGCGDAFRSGADQALPYRTCAAGFAIACAMVKPPPHPARPSGRDGVNDATSLRGGSLAAVIMPAALLSGAASAASFLAQTTGTSSPAEVTILVAARTGAEAGGSALASRSRAATMRDHILPAALGSVLLLVAIVTPPALPLCAIALGLLLGLARPLRAAAIQRVAGDSIRARVASAASACDMAFSSVVLPLAGVWRSRRR